MSEYIKVEITYPNLGEANQAAKTLVESRLAACCQVAGPITSHYAWEGKLEAEQEYHLSAKTKASLFAALSAWVEKNHSYEVPQVLALPIVEISQPYANWLEGSLQ